MLPWDRLAQALTFDMTPADIRAVCRFSYRAGVVIHILFACGWLSLFGLSGFARADNTANENRSLNAKLTTLQAAFDTAQATDKVDKLEAELAGLEQEMFLIRAKLAESAALGRRADALYEQRLAQLQSKHGAVLRQLESARRHPALVRAPSS